MIFQIQIGNQVLTISQNQNTPQFIFELTNLFNHKQYKGFQKFNQIAFNMLAQSLSISNTTNFQITYDAPQSISIIYKHKKIQRTFELNQIAPQTTAQEKQREIQIQSIFDYQNLPQTISLEMKKYPFSSMAQITAKFLIGDKLKNGYAKGFLVSSYLVMTCAHSLYYENMQAKSIFVSFPHISPRLIKATCWFFPEQYRQYSQHQQAEHRCRFDYALIFLSQKVNYKTIKIMTGIEDQVILTSIAGNFPTNQVKRKRNGVKPKEKIKIRCDNPDFDIYKQKTDYNSFKQSYNYTTKMDKDLIYHLVSTQKGLSGSQVFIELNKGKYYAIGIHVAAFKQQKENLAVRFNQRIVKQFQEWQQILIDSTQQSKIRNSLLNKRIVFVSYSPDLINMKDKGFTLIDFEKQIQELKQQADKLSESGRQQMALKYRHKLLSYHQIYSNHHIAQLVNNQLPSYVQQSIQLARIKKGKAEKTYQKTGKKIQHNSNDILLEARKEIIDSAKMIDKTNIRYELQIIFRQFQFLRLQFHQQNEPYNKYRQFTKLIKQISQKQNLLDNKYQQNDAKILINDLQKLKSKVHYYLGRCFSHQKKRKMAQAFQQFVIAKKILNKVEQGDVNEHLKISSEIIRLCKTQHEKIEYKFADCYMQGVQNMQFLINLAQEGNHEALKYLDLSGQFINFIVEMQNQESIAAIYAVLSKYRYSKIMPVKQFAQKALKRLPIKKL